MGWFDKKSWQLRRKIRDLQSELAVAEREGKYVVEQGLFFAELQEMGDATMMVLGTADHLDSEEEEIIRNFFDRNGFSVETLRLDKDHKTLAAVEIIPPQEVTRRVARALKDDGYRLIDDSDQERQPALDKKTLTLSSLIRAISALFAAHVHHLIVTTPLKMNMEGNRLLHWMPLIREAILRKVPQDVVNVCRDPFISAYNHYYGRFGQMANPEMLQNFPDEDTDDDHLEAEPPPMDESLNEQKAAIRAEDSTTWIQPVEELSSDSGAIDRTAQPALFSSPPPDQAAAPAESVNDRAIEAALTLAQIYKALIGATDKRRVRNAEVALDNIARFFSAKSACILSRRSLDAPFTLQANSGSILCLETAEDGTVECETDFLRKAMTDNTLTVLSPDGNGHSNPTGIIVPLELEHECGTVLYLVEPNSYRTGAEDADAIHLKRFAQVFREFPDLLIPGTKSQKS